MVVRSHYRLRVPPCSCYITSGDTQSVRGLLGSEARKVCFRGGWLSALWAVTTAYTLLPEGSLRVGSLHYGSSRCWPRFHRGGSAAAFVGFAVGSCRGNGDGRVPIFFLTCQIHCSALLLSSSEGVDVESADYSPIQSPQYEELLEVVTHALAKLNIDWAAEKQTELQINKLDEHFLRTKSLPPRRSLPFFPDLHTEL